MKWKKVGNCMRILAYHPKQWDNIGRNRVGVDKEESSIFFFTSFVEHYNFKDMFEVIKQFGDSNEVVIRESWINGKRRYGFVCFFNIKDPTFLATKLDNIFMGPKKL